MLDEIINYIQSLQRQVEVLFIFSVPFVLGARVFSNNCTSNLLFIFHAVVFVHEA